MEAELVVEVDHRMNGLELRAVAYLVDFECP